LPVLEVPERDPVLGVDRVEDLDTALEVGVGLGAADHGSGSGATIVTLTPRYS
jgi:hypothetical protein